MISAASKKRAAIFAMWIMRTAPMAKFAAITAPRPRSRQRVSRPATHSSDRPVVPMTSRTPRSSAASATDGVHSAFVKSMTTSGFVASSSDGMSALIGTLPPPGRSTLSLEANFSSTPTGVISAASATPAST